MAHLGGGVLCAGLLVVVGDHTEDTISLLPLGHLVGEHSSLWRDVLMGGQLDSKEDLCLYTSPVVPLYTPWVLWVHAWEGKKRREL